MNAAESRHAKPIEDHDLYPCLGDTVKFQPPGRRDRTTGTVSREPDAAARCGVTSPHSGRARHYIIHVDDLEVIDCIKEKRQ